MSHTYMLEDNRHFQRYLEVLEHSYTSDRINNLVNNLVVGDGLQKSIKYIKRKDTQVLVIYLPMYLKARLCVLSSASI